MLKVRIGLEYPGAVDNELEQKSDEVIGFKHTGRKTTSYRGFCVNYHYWLCYNSAVLANIVQDLLCFVTDQTKIVISRHRLPSEEVHER